MRTAIPFYIEMHVTMQPFAEIGGSGSGTGYRKRCRFAVKTLSNTGLFPNSAFIGNAECSRILSGRYCLPGTQQKMRS
jgi:hypothetical protein